MNDADMREVDAYFAQAPDATVLSMRQETGPAMNPVAAAMTQVTETAEVESTQGQVCRLAEYLAPTGLGKMETGSMGLAAHGQGGRDLLMGCYVRWRPL